MVARYLFCAFYSFLLVLRFVFIVFPSTSLSFSRACIHRFSFFSSFFFSSTVKIASISTMVRTSFTPPMDIILCSNRMKTMARNEILSLWKWCDYATLFMTHISFFLFFCIAFFIFLLDFVTHCVLFNFFPLLFSTFFSLSSFQRSK